MATDAPNRPAMPEPVPAKCRVPTCPNTRAPGRTLCTMHRARLARHGGFELPAREPGPTLAERFWPHVQMYGATGTSELGVCWDWTGRRHVNRARELDYGVMGVWDTDRKMTITRMAHVVAWRVQMHRWPGDGCQVHHVCRNPLCVRADHLLELTSDEHTWVHENWAPDEGEQDA